MYKFQGYLKGPRRSYNALQMYVSRIEYHQETQGSSLKK